MKRSRKIVLTLIASASLGAYGCSSEQATQREIYTSKEKCIEDWGTQENCEENKTYRTYYGPHYYRSGGGIYYFPHGSDKSALLGNNARFSSVAPGMKSPNSFSSFSATKVIRGGFGRSSSFHGGGS